MRFEGTISFTENTNYWLYFVETAFTAPQDGEEYAVTWGDQIYICAASVMYDDMVELTEVSLGSEEISQGNTGGSYPFYIEFMDVLGQQTLNVYTLTDPGEIYLKIQPASEVPEEPEEPEEPDTPVIDTGGFITDRTAADVFRWKELRDKGWPNMTSTEQSEWMGEMKGRYSYTDMNRVETAVKSLSEKMLTLGYLTTAPTTKTDWNRWSVPTLSDMQRYLGNIATLRGAIDVYSDTPESPGVNQRMNYTVANNIEKILLDIGYILTAIPQGWFYAGDLYSGEV